MMFFKSAAPNPTLQLSTSSSGLDGPIAYGPGSVINGTIFLKSSHPIQVQQLYIVFECQVHQQQPTVLFSVTERIQLNQQNTAISYDNTTTVISAGTHMHLFAIQLPLVNYPPSITEAIFPGVCHIDYTLQAFLDRPELPTLFSDIIPLTYLPLIAAQMNDQVMTSRQRQHSLTMQPNSDASIQIHARMMQSAYCLGEQCTIQLTTDNPTNDKINQVYVTLMTRLYHDHPDQQQQHPSQHINYHQAVSISVPKQTKNHVSQVSIPIAQSCLPTFDYHHHQLGITMHVDHHIVIGLTSSHHQQQSSTSARFFSFGSFYSNTTSSSSLSTSTINPLSLPVTITTIPTCSENTPSIPLILQHDDMEGNSSSHQPYFISSSASSPIPTGTNTDNLANDDNEDGGLSDDGQYSVSPSSSFKLDDTFTTDDQIVISTPPPPPPPPPASSLHHHHLAVPSHTNAAH